MMQLVPAGIPLYRAVVLHLSPTRKRGVVTDAAVSA